MRKVIEINAEAYERKASLGGGFRGVAKVKTLGDFELPVGEARRIETGIYPDKQAAWVALYALIEAEAAGRSMTVGHYNGNRFRKNYWVWDK